MLQKIELGQSKVLRRFPTCLPEASQPFSENASVVILARWPYTFSITWWSLLSTTLIQLLLSATANFCPSGLNLMANTGSLIVISVWFVSSPPASEYWNAPAFSLAPMTTLSPKQAMQLGSKPRFVVETLFPLTTRAASVVRTTGWLFPANAMLFGWPPRSVAESEIVCSEIEEIRSLLSLPTVTRPSRLSVATSFTEVPWPLK